MVETDPVPSVPYEFAADFIAGNYYSTLREALLEVLEA
jgi:hypothetical protein